MQTDRLRVLVVDDEARLRAAWERLLRLQPDMELVGSLDRADELVAFIEGRETDVVLLDLSMPGQDPLTAIATAARVRPETKVVLFTGHNDPETARRAEVAGAWGMVDKLVEPLEIVDALRRVGGGERLFPPR